jgi:hypothetical protein
MDPAQQPEVTMTGYNHIVLFLVFMGVAWVVNKLSKRPVMNGAAWYLGVGLTLLCISVAGVVSSSAIDPEARAKIAGNLVGAALIPLAAAVYFANRFKKQKDRVQP